MKEVLNRQKRFELLEKFINNQDIIEGKKLTDIPHFVATYPIKEEINTFKDIKSLEEKLKAKNINFCSINLFELSLEILDNKFGDLPWWLENEQKRQKKDMLKEFQVILSEEVIKERIQEKVKACEAKFLMIYGVGSVFPYIGLKRLLTCLASLQETILFFFPGDHAQSNEKGSFFRLFGELACDHYYRAYNIEDLNL